MEFAETIQFDCLTEVALGAIIHLISSLLTRMCDGVTQQLQGEREGRCPAGQTPLRAQAVSATSRKEAFLTV